MKTRFRLRDAKPYLAQELRDKVSVARGWIWFLEKNALTFIFTKQPVSRKVESGMIFWGTCVMEDKKEYCFRRVVFLSRQHKSSHNLIGARMTLRQTE